MKSEAQNPKQNQTSRTQNMKRFWHTNS